MNILHLHTSLNLSCGITKTIYLITKYPVGSNKQFVLALDGNAGKKFSASNIKVRFLNLNRDKILNIFKIIGYLKKYIKENNIDIIHCHHRFFDTISYYLSFFLNVKRITSVQSFVYGKKLLSYKSPVLLAAGESVKKHLKDYFGIKENRIIVFNNFVDVNEIPKEVNVELLKKELNIRDNSYVVGYAGRFSIAEKGIDILLNSFKLFKEKHSETYLVMIGGGKDSIRVKDIPKDVIILDSKENIFDYYKIFDCMVLPSRTDPFPLTALEAGMMKIPFIGADVNGISEIIKDGEEGLLFEKENTKMLLEKMGKFYSQEEFARRCAGNLYNKVINKYNSSDAIELINNIYQKI